MSSWSFRGTALDSFGIVTLVSDSLRMPERRGGNVLLPFRDGRIHVEKYLDQRRLTLGLEIHTGSLEDLEEAVDDLKGLLGLTLGELRQTMESGAARTAMAEFTGDLGVARVSPLALKLTLEFTLPDPLFYGDEEVVYDYTTLNVVSIGDEESVVNPGTARVKNAVITLAGPMENAVIHNTTNGAVLSYGAAIATGRVVTIDVDESTGDFRALDDLGTNVIGNVEHEGDFALMVLEPGENLLTFLDDLGGGDVTISFYPPYL